MILVFGSIFKGTIGDGVKFTQYFVTGMIATCLMTAGFQALAIQIPMERDRGVLKRFLGTPMPKWVYFAGKVLMVAFIAVLETVILLAVATLLFGLKLPSSGGTWLTFLWVAVLGITAYRTAFGRPQARLGLQEETIGGRPVWVLPNPSGLNAHHQLPELARLFGAARAFAESL